MSERQKQTVFLKRLLQRDESPLQHQLQRRIAKAEQDERCVLKAMHIVGVTGLLSLAGLCYEAIFFDDFFQNPSHFLTRLLGCLGLGSTLCWVMFLGYWWWHRALTNRLYEECRRLIIAEADSCNGFVGVALCSDPGQADASKLNTHAEPCTHPLPKAA